MSMWHLLSLLAGASAVGGIAYGPTHSSSSLVWAIGGAASVATFCAVRAFGERTRSYLEGLPGDSFWRSDLGAKVSYAILATAIPILGVIGAQFGRALTSIE